MIIPYQERHLSTPMSVVPILQDQFQHQKLLFCLDEEIIIQEATEKQFNIGDMVFHIPGKNEVIQVDKDKPIEQSLSFLQRRPLCLQVKRRNG